MKYLQNFDYIIENVSQARKILKENDIDKDDIRFKRIVDKTKRDGYIGIITKLVFEFGLSLNEALAIYETLKSLKINIGDYELVKKLDDEKSSNQEKIQAIHDIIKKTKVANAPIGGYNLLFESGGYNVYMVDSYYGILCTGSPAWCLKTKSHWKSYTETKRGTQFVLIKSDFVKDGKIEMIVPNTWNSGSYKNETGSPKDRYGVTIYPYGRMDIFDDNNMRTQASYINNVFDTSSRIPEQAQQTIIDTHKYFTEKIQPNLAAIKQPNESDLQVVDFNDDYGNFKEILENIVFNEMDYRGNTSFSVLAKDYTRNQDVEGNILDNHYNELITLLKHGLGYETVNEIYDFMREYKALVLADDLMLSHSGVVDFFLNQFLIYDYKQEHDDISDFVIEDCPNITKSTPLGGDFFDETEVGDLTVKYHYGYQYNKYGNAALKQGFGDIKSFYTRIAENFLEVLTDEQFLYMESITSYYDIEQFKETFYTVTPYKDGYMIKLNFKKISATKTVDNINDDVSKDDIVNDLNTWFDGTKADGDIILIPICSYPNKKDDKETQS